MFETRKNVLGYSGKKEIPHRKRRLPHVKRDFVAAHTPAPEREQGENGQKSTENPKEKALRRLTSRRKGLPGFIRATQDEKQRTKQGLRRDNDDKKRKKDRKEDRD